MCIRDRFKISVCLGTACYVKGAGDIPVSYTHLWRCRWLPVPTSWKRGISQCQAMQRSSPRAMKSARLIWAGTDPLTYKTICACTMTYSGVLLQALLFSEECREVVLYETFTGQDFEGRKSKGRKRAEGGQFPQPSDGYPLSLIHIGCSPGDVISGSTPRFVRWKLPGRPDVYKRQIQKYSSLKVYNLQERIFKVTDMIEKPSPDKIMSLYSILGRCVLPPEIFSILEHTKPCLLYTSRCV